MRLPPGPSPPGRASTRCVVEGRRRERKGARRGARARTPSARRAALRLFRVLLRGVLFARAVGHAWARRLGCVICHARREMEREAQGFGACFVRQKKKRRAEDSRRAASSNPGRRSPPSHPTHPPFTLHSPTPHLPHLLPCRSSPPTPWPASPCGTASPSRTCGGPTACWPTTGCMGDALFQSRRLGGWRPRAPPWRRWRASL
jgi:hypothetical protein